MSNPALPSAEKTQKDRKEAEDYAFAGLKKLVVVSFYHRTKRLLGTDAYNWLFSFQALPRMPLRFRWSGKTTLWATRCDISSTKSMGYIHFQDFLMARG